jgi:hypothetical protein
VLKKKEWEKQFGITRNSRPLSDGEASDGSEAAAAPLFLNVDCVAPQAILVFVWSGPFFC